MDLDLLRIDINRTREKFTVLDSVAYVELSSNWSKMEAIGNNSSVLSSTFF